MPTYRAFPVDEAGHVCAPPREFNARSDVEAIAFAMMHIETHAVEVWDHERRVGVIQPDKDEDWTSSPGLQPPK